MMMINVLPGTGRTKRPKLSMEKAAGLKRVINQIFSRATTARLVCSLGNAPHTNKPRQEQHY